MNEIICFSLHQRNVDFLDNIIIRFRGINAEADLKIF